MNTSSVNPAWLRVSDATTYSGLSRTALFEACVTGEIQSVHRCKPGSKKGVRLISRASLDAYISSYLPGGSRYQQPKRRGGAGNE